RSHAMNSSPIRPTASAVLALLLASASVACSSEPDQAPASSGDPVYVAFVGVPAPEGQTYYATTLPALDGSEISLDEALEIPGDRGNRMYLHGDAVFVGEG